MLSDLLFIGGWIAIAVGTYLAGGVPYLIIVLGGIAVLLAMALTGE
jgi:hypothetical protein